MDLYSNFIFKNIAIELSSYDNWCNIVYIKSKFVGTLTMLPCIPYCQYLSSWNNCANARHGANKHSSILLKVGRNLKFDWFVIC
jgi:hypothetical protein